MTVPSVVAEGLSGMVMTIPYGEYAGDADCHTIVRDGSQ